MNEMSIIDESQEKTDLINIKGFDNTVNVEQDRKDHLNKMESNYKIVHKEENSKLLDFIKNKIKIPSKSLSIHDSFINIYFNRQKSAVNRHIINSSKRKRKRKGKRSSFSTSTNFFKQEEELNNVEKFILNTKKLRYTLNIKEKDIERERNLSYDLRGNIKNYFEGSLKINHVFFDDLYDELTEQYNINNKIHEKRAKKLMVKEILEYYLNKKGVNLQFGDKISKKYLSMIIKKAGKDIRKTKKTKAKKIIQKKEVPNLIEIISKKIHKKIHIKRARILIESDTKTKNDRIRKNKSADNFYKNKYHNILINLYRIYIDKNERKFTQNNYLEIETNSSEFSDIPSELDSEISEIIRIKHEKEKNAKETEGGIYAEKTDTKKKGEDFIIDIILLS